MEIQILKQRGVQIVTFSGESLDAGNIETVKPDLLSKVEDSNKVIFDLTQVEFIDSSGLGVILSCYRVIKAGKGELKLCGLSSVVRSLFELVRMNRVFDIYETPNEALEAYF